MLFTADQFVAHVAGDYLLQSDWMAQRKVTRTWPALVHATFYALTVGIFVQASPQALWFIGATHFVIDRWRLARFVVFAKNFLAPPSVWPSWWRCFETGYDRDRPAWLSVWLLIIADNLLHVGLNALALRWWP